MSLVRWGLFLLLVGCQLPPDHAAGRSPDLAAPALPDLSGPLPDLATPPVIRDLSLADLTPPILDGNVQPSPTVAATLNFNVTDRDTGLPTPSRVIFRPPPGAGFCDTGTTWDPNSPGSATGAVVSAGVLGAPEGVLLVTGLGSVPVPPGDYDLFITRGPEYEAVQLHVSLTPGETERIDAELDRTVDTAGWLAADLHVHSKSSFDSRIPMERRVISMVTNGIELIVSTEHNNAVDFSPIIASLGYGSDLLGSVVGDEFNFKNGHGGAYPVAFDANAPGGGVPQWTNDPCVPGVGVQCTLAGQMFDIMHMSIAGSTAVTINHAYWPGSDLGYFTNIPWGVGTANPPPMPLETAGKFDALEVLNGYLTPSDRIYALVADWMFLLSQGYRVTALGSSDTHKINWVRAGWPRSFLRLPTDVPGDVSAAQLGDAVRLGRAVATTGPFAELLVDGHGVGDTVVPGGANVTVDIRVDAPDWMKIDTVRLYKNGQLAHEWPVAAGHRPVFQTTIQEPVSGDGWLVLQADGAQPLPGDVVGEIAHFNGNETRPFVLTNPVYLDGNGDGQWVPPSWPGIPKPFDKPMIWQRTRSFEGPVPEGCGPNETEPPLDAAGMAARYLAPLVNP
jgi:hypothetical protein